MIHSETKVASPNSIGLDELWDCSVDMRSVLSSQNLVEQTCPIRNKGEHSTGASSDERLRNKLDTNYKDEAFRDNIDKILVDKYKTTQRGILCSFKMRFHGMDYKNN